MLTDGENNNWVQTAGGDILQIGFRMSLSIRPSLFE